MLRHTMTIDRILIVGSGITGALTAAFCRQTLPTETKISIWDKAHCAGGRMSTSRCTCDNTCSVDLGAQYITLDKHYTVKRTGLFQELLSAGILSPLQGKIEGDPFSSEGSQHFVTQNGVSSLVNYYLSLSDAETKYGHHVNRLDYITKDNKYKVIVSTFNGTSEEFDAVILTQPVPQILQLTGDINNSIDKSANIKEKLKNVLYSSRFAVGIFYDRGSQLNYDWCMKYYTDHQCIRYISIDTKKRGLANEDTAPSVVVHTNVVPFSLEHLEKGQEEVGLIVLKYLKDLLPDLPEPKEVQHHKWRYSQVHKSYDGKPGCIVIEDQPLVILGGDGFTQSGFNGCVDSAEAIINFIYKQAKIDI